MWEAITFFLALPLLSMVGSFYYRIAAWAFVNAGSAWQAYNDRLKKDRQRTPEATS